MSETAGNLFSLAQLIVSFLLQILEDFPVSPPKYSFLISCPTPEFFVSVCWLWQFIQDNYLTQIKLHFQAGQLNLKCVGSTLPMAQSVVCRYI
jgi:hypothetical protein